MTVKVGTLSADLDLDGNPFERNLDRMMDTGAQKAQRIGGTMTKSVTLPLVAAGGAAVKMGMDFETSMSRMVGLVGLTTNEVDDLRSGIMDLSSETAKGPQELADAMFTVTSAGFRGAEAMDVLTSAAKASAAGLGETRTIAEALTGAVNAYGPEVLDAARATDILVATARAGNFESSQLAGVLGKITPFAKQAGASLEDVGGAIALLTRVNNNATESGTQVAAMMRSFVTPTQEAKTEMDKLYGSTQDFRDIIARDGLVAALQDLDGKLGGNREQLGRILGSSEAASAAFQILDADADTLAGTFGTVTDSVGMTDEAFGAAAETSGFKMQQAIAQLQAALIDAGDAIAPFVAAVAGGIGTAAEAFSKLPEPVQNAAIALGALLAATGPLVSIGGRIATNWRTISGVFDTASGSASGLAGKLSLAKTAALGLAGVAVVGAIHAWRNEMQEAKSDAQDFVDTFTAGSIRPVESLSELHDEIMRVGAASAEMKRRGDEALNPFLKSRFREAEEGLNETRDALLDVEAAAAELQAELGITADEAVRMATNTDTMAAALDPATGELDANAAAAQDAAAAQQDFEDAIKGVTDAIRAQLDPLFATMDALDGHKDAQDAVKAAELEAIAAQNDLNEAVANHGPKSKEATDAAWQLMEAQNKVTDANDKVVRSALDVAGATAELKMRVDEGTVSLEEAEAQLRAWVEQGLITEQQAFNTAEKLRGTASAADDLGGRNIVIPVSADTSRFNNAVANLFSGLGGRSVTIPVNAAPPGFRERWTGGPVLPDEDYLVGERGPELIRMTGGAAVVENAGQTRNTLAGVAGTGSGSQTRSVALANGNVIFQVSDAREAMDEAEHRLRMIELGNP